MSTQMLRLDFDTHHQRSRVRSILAVVAIAAAGYVSGVLVEQALSPRNEAGVAIAQPARAADLDINDGSPAVTSAAFVPSIAEARGFDPESTLMPRECNLEAGISTVCVFMD